MLIFFSPSSPLLAGSPVVLTVRTNREVLSTITVSAGNFAASFLSTLGKDFTHIEISALLQSKAYRGLRDFTFLFDETQYRYINSAVISTNEQTAVEINVDGETENHSFICFDGRLANPPSLANMALSMRSAAGAALYFYEEEVHPIAFLSAVTVRIYDYKKNLLFEWSTPLLLNYLNLPLLIADFNKTYFHVKLYDHHDDLVGDFHITIEKSVPSMQKYIVTFLNSYGFYEKLLMYGQGKADAAWERGDASDIQRYFPSDGGYLRPEPHGRRASVLFR
jgi:hypothetical protein